MMFEGLVRRIDLWRLQINRWRLLKAQRTLETIDRSRLNETSRSLVEFSLVRVSRLVAVYDLSIQDLKEHLEILKASRKARKTARGLRDLTNEALFDEAAAEVSRQYEEKIKELKEFTESTPNDH